MVPVLSSSIRFTTRWLGGLQVSCHGAGAGAGQYLSGTLWANRRARALFGPRGGPDVALFKRFQTGWPYTDQSAYETASDDNV